MNRRNARYLTPLALLAGACIMGAGLLAVATAQDAPADTGPDVVVMRELAEIYEPVPFDHKSHATMAEMGNGCVTCHHRSPEPEQRGDKGATLVAAGKRTQAEAARVPACKSCHPVAAAEATFNKPGLKGAYHRQCLNCHKEWMNQNACGSCHEPRKDGPVAKAGPTPDDITGRMHPPIAEPEMKTYKTRYTPAAGGNVMFRHREHTIEFGIKCANCHHQDNCAHCHDPEGKVLASKPLRPGLTLEESHKPCISCHAQDRCQHCHYRNTQAPPQAFDHAATGQGLDKDHAKIACDHCHPKLVLAGKPVCGDAACHKQGPIEYPAQRPGPLTTPAQLWAKKTEEPDAGTPAMPPSGTAGATLGAKVKEVKSSTTLKQKKSKKQG